MVRTLGGIVVGTAAAIALMMVTEAAGNQVAPPPARMDLSDLADTPPLPLLTLLFPLLGLLLGALAGGYLAMMVSEKRWTGWAITAVVLAATLFNLVLLAYPIWYIVAAPAMPIIGGALAQRVRTRDARPGDPSA